MCILILSALGLRLAAWTTAAHAWRVRCAGACSRHCKDAVAARELSICSRGIEHRLIGVSHGSQQLNHLLVGVIDVFVNGHTVAFYGRWRFGLVMRLINGFATGRMAGFTPLCGAGFANGRANGFAPACGAGFANGRANGFAPTCGAGFANGRVAGGANGRVNFFAAGLLRLFSKGRVNVLPAVVVAGWAAGSSSPRSSGRVRAVVGL